MSVTYAKYNKYTGVMITKA